MSESPRLSFSGALARAAIAIFMIAIVGMACRKPAPEAEAAGASKAVVGARTVVVTPQSFTRTLDALGTVLPRAGHFSALSAPAATRVTRIQAAIGQRVAKGQSLIEFDRAPFDAAAQSAEAALATAERAAARAQRLADAGIIPRKELDQATSELAQARSNLVAARRAQEFSVVHAPIAGVVTRMSAVLGASVDANQPLVEVVDPSALDIVASVSPADAALVRPGTSVAFREGNDERGGSLGGGVVADVSASVDSATRAVPIRITAGHLARVLRVGETIFARIAVTTHENAITVPTESLVPDGEAFKVFVVDSAGIAHARPVTVGARTETRAEITQGLRAGERIVTYGAYGVDEGAKIATEKR
jgi:membrane fusion protein (multidrug efflux system)